MSGRAILPMLSERDDAAGMEGGIDPLGLAAIADRLGSRLVPGVRERQLHPRFLTVMAVSLAVCDEFDEDTLAIDGISEPWQVFEWFFVEGMVRTSRATNGGASEVRSPFGSRTVDEAAGTRGVPGSLKAWVARRDGVPLSAKNYLKSPGTFGFHAVYRLLARRLGIEHEQSGRLGATGIELLDVWAREQGLDGFNKTSGGPGRSLLRDVVKAIADGLKSGSTAVRSDGWNGWRFFREHLDLYAAGEAEIRFLMQQLLNENDPHRSEVFEFLMSPTGRLSWDDRWLERAFHQELQKAASDDLEQLLQAIGCFESFAQQSQLAFEACLMELTRMRAPVSLKQLGALPDVVRGSQLVPDLFAESLSKLEPYGESARLSQKFGNLATRCSSSDWVDGLLRHHCETQKRKLPSAKLPWAVPLDGGSWQVRTRYRLEEMQNSLDEYVHRYRTHSLWSFAKDMKRVS